MRTIERNWSIFSLRVSFLLLFADRRGVAFAVVAFVFVFAFVFAVAVQYSTRRTVILFRREKRQCYIYMERFLNTVPEEGGDDKFLNKLPE